MSSFFTTPASQRKRKRATRDDTQDVRRRKVDARRPTTKSLDASDNENNDDDDDDDDDDDESMSEGERSAHTVTEDSSSGEDDEDPTGRRTRLAERYLENTRKQVLAEGFDAEDIDRELLAERMGERLNEDTAETKGKLYRWIADDFSLSGIQQTRFRSDANVVTAVAVCYPHVYTAAKDSSLVKWQLPTTEPTMNGSGASRLAKPKKLISTRGQTTQDSRGNIEQHKGPILCVAASDDGRFVATGGQDKTIIVWDTADLRVLRVFPQHRDSIVSLCFRTGTNQMFSASKDRTIKMWSLNELAYIESLFGHQDAILDIDALAEETCVSVGARDKTARFWRVVDETQLVFRGGGGFKRSKGDGDDKQYAEGSIERVAMIDSETFVTGSDNGSLSLWSIQKKKAVFTYPLAHGLQPQTRLEDASAEQHPDPACVAEAQPRWITALKALPLSNIFVTGSWDGYVRAWKVSEDKRRIEPLGPLIRAETFNGNGELAKIDREGGLDHTATAKGVVNDLALFERGDRGRDGLFVVAAVGKEHRLGRWLKVDGGRNEAVLYHLPRSDKSANIELTNAEDA